MSIVFAQFLTRRLFADWRVGEKQDNRSFGSIDRKCYELAGRTVAVNAAGQRSIPPRSRILQTLSGCDAAEIMVLQTDS